MDMIERETVIYSAVDRTMSESLVARMLDVGEIDSARARAAAREIAAAACLDALQAAALSTPPEPVGRE